MLKSLELILLANGLRADAAGNSSIMSEKSSWLCAAPLAVSPPRPSRLPLICALKLLLLTVDTLRSDLELD